MSTSPLKALVAEDEPAMLSLMARHMKTLGFEVVEAPNGDKAWELAERHQPDLVVLDVMMPGMSGWEVCKRIKSDASSGHPLARTGVIMLTGIGENLNELTSPLFAADAWLNKPFEFAELDVKVRETLSRYGKSLPSRESKKAVERAVEAPAKESKMRHEDDEHEGGGEDRAEEGSKRASRRGESAKHPAKSKKESAGASKKASRPAAKSVKKPAAKKPAPKKPAAKKPAAKKPAAKKPAAKKPAAKKPAAKKPAAKKPAAKKPAAKKPAAKKPAAKKPAAKKPAAKKPAAKTAKVGNAKKRPTKR